MSALQIHGPSDEELARRTGAGDVDAFEELYRRYAGPLTAYAGRLLRDRVAAEDAAQVALLNAYQALRRGSAPRHTRAWLFTITRNVVLEVIDRRDDSTPLAERASAPDAHAANEARDDLLTALRTLPERQRKVFVLRELQGLRIREIGERLALAPEQVEQALFAARNRLAEHLTFGERVDCASVQSLDVARLSRAERRAIKSHVRACPSCRTSASRVRLGVLLLPLDWARNAALALFGGGGAAKAAAVVAAVAAAGAAPIVGDELPITSARAAAPVRTAVEPGERQNPEPARLAPRPAQDGPTSPAPAAVPVAMQRPPAAPEPVDAVVETAPEPEPEPAPEPESEPEPQPEPEPEPEPAPEPERPEERPADVEPEPAVNDEAPAIEAPRPERLANAEVELYEAEPSKR